MKRCPDCGSQFIVAQPCYSDREPEMEFLGYRAACTASPCTWRGTMHPDKGKALEEAKA